LRSGLNILFDSGGVSAAALQRRAVYLLYWYKSYLLYWYKTALLAAAAASGFLALLVPNCFTGGDSARLEFVRASGGVTNCSNGSCNCNSGANSMNRALIEP
jgi:hypothetical protein